MEAPANYLAKVSRAMTEAPSTLHNGSSVADKISQMLGALESRRTYDIVLIDARAGLAEVAAGPMLSIGVSVLLFGTPQAQTLQGLRFLFAHLSSLVNEGQRSPWQALKMVHAKAQLAKSHERFKDQLWDLFSEYLYEEQVGLEGFNFDPGAVDAPHNPIPIPLDSAFTDWDPVSEPSQLLEDYYSRTFGALLQYVEDSLRQGNS